jgi:hypothetical protein
MQRRVIQANIQIERRVPPFFSCHGIFVAGFARELGALYAVFDFAEFFDAWWGVLEDSLVEARNKVVLGGIDFGGVV